MTDTRKLLRQLRETVEKWLSSTLELSLPGFLSLPQVGFSVHRSNESSWPSGTPSTLSWCPEKAALWTDEGLARDSVWDQIRETAATTLDVLPAM